MPSESNAPVLDDAGVLSRVIRARRAVRDFGDRVLEDEVLTAILDDARHAPSGYNLQPTHFVVVRGERRLTLCKAAFDQRQIRDAPVTVALVVDLRADRTHFEAVTRADLAAGVIDEAALASTRSRVRLTFARGPLGLVGRAKGWATRLLGRFRPMPEFPAADPARWASRQAMMVGAHLLLAATARGVASCPMEGFGEVRARLALGVPAGYRVALLIPLGYASEGREPVRRRSRLPLDPLIHDGEW